MKAVTKYQILELVIRFILVINSDDV